MNHADYLLSRRPLQDQVHRAGHCTAVEPSIGIDAKGLSTQILQMTWFLYGLEKPMKSYVLSTHTIPPLDSIKGT